MKFDILSVLQLFRKLTKDVRSYVQKVYLPSILSLLFGEHGEDFCILTRIYLFLYTDSV